MASTTVLQNTEEFKEFISVLRQEKVKSYLEIGSKYGGSLKWVAGSLPGIRLVSVDLPINSDALKILKGAVDELSADGYDATLYVGDSTDPHVITRVAKHAPFDAVFIDGNHTLPFVTKDWENYGPMARMIAFHDIGWDISKNEPRRPRLPIEAPILWEKLKTQYRYYEIKLDQGHNGIGVLWKD